MKWNRIIDSRYGGVWGGVCGRREGECVRCERKKQLKRSRDINSKCRVDMWKGEGV